MRAQEKQVPEFYTGSWPYPLFQVMSCEARLEDISSEGMAVRHYRGAWAPQEQRRCSVGLFVSYLVTCELQEGYD